LDAICVLGKGIINHVHYQERYPYGVTQGDDGVKVGWFFELWGDASLAGLLLKLELSYSSVLKMRKSLLFDYLIKISEDIELKFMRYVED
jgi:hypothetical protein